jgi:hypothetical protein
VRLGLALTFVIALTTAALGQSEKAAVQNLDYVTDSEAHLIYATVVPEMWASTSSPQDPIVLQQETTDVSVMGVSACGSWLPRRKDPEWVEIWKNFLQENARRKVLPLALPISQPYRLITLAEIAQINARLGLQVPGDQPDDPPYVAVSAIGFNSDKTKAIVYVRVRNRGHWSGMERRDGKWITAPDSEICTWIA